MLQKSSIKIIFFGSFEFAVPALEALVSAGYDIVAVVTNPDRLSGRKKILTPPPVKIAAQKLGLNVLQPEKLRSSPEPFGPDGLTTEGLVEGLKNLNLSVGIVVGYGQLIPPEIFNLPKHSTLNIHPSLLPKYRGPSPVQTAMLNGDHKTGVTIIKIDEEMDHGDIVAMADYELSSNASTEEAHSALFNLGAELLIKVLPDYLAGKIKPQSQDHLKATYTHKFTTGDGEIKPTAAVETTYNKIRALNPEPGTYIWLEKNSSPRSGGAGKPMRLKILSAELKDGHLEFKKVQLEGGQPMDFKEFLAGHPNFKNNLL